MEYQLTVVGTGPGSPEYLLPVARQAIDKAGVIVGSKQSLQTFAPEGSEQMVINGDLPGLFQHIEDKLSSSDVVVMVSGDPGFYSLLAALKKRFSQRTIRVIPGISSFQLAFAAIGEYWQDAEVTSMHGRLASDQDLAYKCGKKLATLTDSQNNPPHIAKQLLSLGWPGEAKVWLCANLARPDEQIHFLTLSETAAITGFNYCVMVVKG